jgi:hypothetical protein
MTVTKFSVKIQQRLATVSFLLVAALSVADVVAAQEFPEPGDDVYEVQLVDGSSVFARVASVDGDRVTLTTIGGVEIVLNRMQIREMRLAEGGIVEGQFWRRDRNNTRLFFTSTGRSLAQGEAYVGTYLLFLPFVAVGVTDDFTIAAGAPVLFGQFDPFYVAPKLRVMHSGSAEVSIGTFALLVDGEGIGIAYGVGTFGSQDRAMTVGLGFGFAGSDFLSQPVAMIGGEVRANASVKLITENYFLPGETGAVISGGIRLIGERFSTDLGIMGFAGDGDTGCCLPVVNFSYAFGKKAGGR